MLGKHTPCDGRNSVFAIRAPRSHPTQLLRDLVPYASHGSARRIFLVLGAVRSAGAWRGAERGASGRNRAGRFE